MKHLSFTCDRCGKESQSAVLEEMTQQNLPDNWVTIIEGGLIRMESGKTHIYAQPRDFHFCSEKCLSSWFFPVHADLPK